MDEKVITKLNKAGLSELEAKVYMAVLVLGGAYPSKVAEETGINRSTVYKTLTTLSVRGLVSEIEKAKKLYYQAEKPDRLLRAATYKKCLADDALVEAKNLIPELEGIFAGSASKPKVLFYEGKDRVIEAYMTHVEIKKGYEMRCFLSTFDLRRFLSDKKLRHYIELKEKIGIPVRIIAPANKQTEEFPQAMFRGIKKKFWPNIRTVSKEYLSFPAEITLYDNDKISIVKFDEKNPVAIIIIDKTIYEMIGMFFELIWKGGKQI